MEDAIHDCEANDGLAALRRFAVARPDVAHCELCGVRLAVEHPHMLHCETRDIACACDACSLLFCGGENARFMRLPRRILKLQNFALDQEAWDALMLPINVAFFLRTKDDKTEVLYPSPAGAMRSELALPGWLMLFGSNQTLRSVEPETEALLAYRIADAHSYHLIPLDSCYELIGLIRTNWHGLSGGTEVWRAVAAYFSRLDARATDVGEAAHA